MYTHVKFHFHVHALQHKHGSRARIKIIKKKNVTISLLTPPPLRSTSHAHTWLNFFFINNSARVWRHPRHILGGHICTMYIHTLCYTSIETCRRRRRHHVCKLNTIVHHIRYIGTIIKWVGVGGGAADWNSYTIPKCDEKDRRRKNRVCPANWISLCECPAHFSYIRFEISFLFIVLSLRRGNLLATFFCC